MRHVWGLVVTGLLSQAGFKTAEKEITIEDGKDVTVEIVLDRGDARID